MRVLFCFVALAFGLHTPFSFGSEKTVATVEVDLRFSPGPNGLPPANEMDGVRTEPLNQDGFAVFTQATQLPDSDFYIGYWIAVSKSPDGVEWPFNVQIYYNDFHGLLELEPGKRSPIMRLVEKSAWLMDRDIWQEVELRDRARGEMLAIVYIRLRTNKDTEQGTAKAPKPVIIEAGSRTAK